jgi:hypothetical protein
MSAKEDLVRDRAREERAVVVDEAHDGGSGASDGAG